MCFVREAINKSEASFKTICVIFLNIYLKYQKHIAQHQDSSTQIPIEVRLCVYMRCADNNIYDVPLGRRIKEEEEEGKDMI